MNLAFNAFAIFNVGLTPIGEVDDKKIASGLDSFLSNLNAPFSLKAN